MKNDLKCLEAIYSLPSNVEDYFWFGILTACAKGKIYASELLSQSGTFADSKFAGFAEHAAKHEQFGMVRYLMAHERFVHTDALAKKAERRKGKKCAQASKPITGTELITENETDSMQKRLIDFLLGDLVRLVIDYFNDDTYPVVLHTHQLAIPSSP